MATARLIRVNWKWLRWGVFVIVLSSACSHGAEFGEPAMQQTLTELVEKKRMSSDAPKLAVAIMQSGRVVGHAVATDRNEEKNGQVNSEEIWHFGSNGKSITALVAGRIIEKGFLSFETTIAEALSDVDVVISQEYRDVTILDLLRHRGGIYNVSPKKVSVQQQPTDLSARENRLAILRDALATPPSTTPKSEFKYSNVGYGIVAAILEEVTDSEFEQLVLEEVYEPLGLKSAGVGYEFPTDQQDGKISHLEIKGDLVPMSVSEIVSELGLNTALTPAGGFYMSFIDWLTYCNEHIQGVQGNGKLLGADSYKMLHSPPPNGSYAAGWDVAVDSKGYPEILIHNGGGLHMSYAFIDLKEELVIVVATNSLSQRIHKNIVDFRRELAIFVASQ